VSVRPGPIVASKKVDRGVILNNPNFKLLKIIEFN
jgi:hypothetical protein